MTALLFNSNYLFILLPSEAQLALLNRTDEIFSLHCWYDYYPVTDLYQEWGYKNFPSPTAIGAAIFQACPSAKNLNDTEDPQIKSGELYWITIYPTILPGEPVDILCFADADRMYFGVAINQEEAIPLSTLSSNEVREAWLQVRIENIFRVNTDFESDKEEVAAHLVIHGEPFSEWTKAVVRPIVNEEEISNCWENFPEDYRPGIVS